jgi:hypothetical protein
MPSVSCSGARRVVGRVEVRGSRGEGEGRQVGQFEGSLFCAEGPVYGRKGAFHGYLYLEGCLLRRDVVPDEAELPIFVQPTTRLGFTLSILDFFHTSRDNGLVCPFVCQITPYF